jgi:hypothetical protein
VAGWGPKALFVISIFVGFIPCLPAGRVIRRGHSTFNRTIRAEDEIKKEFL